MKDKIVKIVLQRCLGYKKGETLLIVTDDELEDLAFRFYQGAHKLNIEAIIMKMAPRKIHGEEPPSVIAEALKSVDFALLVTKKSLSHTKARKEACQKYGTRIASLPGLTEAVFKRSIMINYDHLKKRVKKLASLLTKGDTLKVTTEKGTHLTASIKGRKGFEDNGLYIYRGAFGNLPAGEACIGPLEGSANGRVVVDASMAPLGRLKRPIELIIKNGYVKKISSKKLASVLKGLGNDTLNFAEFGIGLNPKAKITGNVLEDEKVIGTAHIAIGNNRSFGGKVNAPCHLDGIFFNPQITIDGKSVKKNFLK